MTTDRKFLEGYASVMRENGVSPVEAFQLMEKSARFPLRTIGRLGARGATSTRTPLKSIGLFAGGAATAGALGLGGMKVYDSLKNAKKDFELYQEGLENGLDGISSNKTDSGKNNYKNWSDTTSSDEGDTSTGTSPNNVDPLTARKNALERKHYEALTYSADKKLREKQKEYDEDMQNFTDPSTLITMASRVPGLNYLTDIYNNSQAKKLEKSKKEVEDLIKSLNESKANVERYK
jgi:hypothetical protein